MSSVSVLANEVEVPFKRASSTKWLHAMEFDQHKRGGIRFAETLPHPHTALWITRIIRGNLEAIDVPDCGQLVAMRTSNVESINPFLHRPS